MNRWLIIAAVIFLVISYVFAYPIFIIAVLLAALYGCMMLWRWIQRLRAPPGHRIRHGLLKGHLVSNYGTKQGTKLYKETVRELRGRGYR